METINQYIDHSHNRERKGKRVNVNRKRSEKKHESTHTYEGGRRDERQKKESGRTLNATVTKKDSEQSDKRSDRDRDKV